MKIRFFEKGAAAVRNVWPIDQECYRCPICGQFYLRGALDVGILTIEHAPPRQAGGKPLALTCKECNSVAGYSVDSAVVERERQLDFVKALTGQKEAFKGRGTFRLGEETLNIDLEKDKGTLSIRPVIKVNDPKRIQANREYMAELSQAGQWDGQTFTLTSYSRYSPKRAKVGDLKTAFIICFAFFGYTYALNRRLSHVREQIASYEKDIIDWYWLTSDAKVVQDHFICLVEEPVAAIAVKLDNATILLPWLEGPKDFYGYLREHHVEKGAVTFKGSWFNWPRTLEMKLDFMKNE